MDWRGFAIVGLLAGSACATTETPPAAGDSADPQYEAQLFVDAVYRFCVPSVEGAETTDNTAADIGLRPILPSEDSLLGQYENGQYRSEAGVVQVDNSTSGKCRVVAYALPVRGVLDVVAASIQQPGLGYVELDMPTGPMAYARAFAKDSDGQRFAVVLTGTEPGRGGARSRFSSLTATVQRN